MLAGVSTGMLNCDTPAPLVRRTAWRRAVGSSAAKRLAIVRSMSGVWRNLKLSPIVWLDSRYIKGPKKMAVAKLPGAEQIACFLHHYARAAASLFPVLSGDQ